MRPTGRALLIFALGVLAGVPAIVVHRSLWLVWPIFVVGFLAALLWDGAVAHSRRPHKVDLRLPSSGEVGAPLTAVAAITLTRPGSRTLTLRLLADDIWAGARSAITHIPPTTQTAEVSLQLTPTRRGTPALQGLELEWTGPWGLAAMRATLDTNRTVSVTPHVEPIRRAAIRLEQSTGLLGGRLTRFVGDGSEFEQLREFQVGLDPRSISWKASARHHKLLAQQFRSERDHQVVLAVDAGHVMQELSGTTTKLDHAITEALWLAWTALTAGDRVGFASLHERLGEFAPPRSGRAAFSQIAHVAATTTYRAVETNFSLSLRELATRVTRRALIVVFTDLVDSVMAELLADHLLMIARHHTVLLVVLADEALNNEISSPPHALHEAARSAVAFELRRERHAVTDRLRRAGVHCVETRPGQLSHDVINTYLELKRREAY